MDVTPSTHMHIHNGKTVGRERTVKNENYTAKVYSKVVCENHWSAIVYKKQFLNRYHCLLTNF